MNNCTVTGNSVGGNFFGGGLYNIHGTVTLNGCTFYSNTATGYGGALYNQGTATLINCTFDGNTAGFDNDNYYGGGIYNDGSASLTNCTISDNKALKGGGIYNFSGTVQLTQSIIARNHAHAAGNDIDNQSTLSSGGFNIVQVTADTNTNWNPYDLLGVDPGLGSLGSYGGLTQTVPLLPGSPALKAGLAVLPIDQRGEIRTDGGADIGAFQASLVVQTADGDVNITRDGLTLPGAVQLANVFPGTQISFDEVLPDRPGHPIIDPPKFHEITINKADIALTDTLLTTTITGPSDGLMTVRGPVSGRGRIFRVDRGVSATLEGLVITGGHASAGGGVLSNGNVTLINCTITGNHCGTSGGGGLLSNGTGILIACTVSNNVSSSWGGGITGEGLLLVFNSTISGNEAQSLYGGGGIFLPNIGSMIMVNSTLVGNKASQGGGLMTFGAGCTLTFCTVTGNQSGLGGGIRLGEGGVTLLDAIVAGNTAGPKDATPNDISGEKVAGSFNLIGPGGSGGLTKGSNGNIVLTKAELPQLKLGPLANNGGPTQTIALLPGSVGLGQGSSANYPNTSLVIGIDQRLLPRPGKAHKFDIGAFQNQ